MSARRSSAASEMSMRQFLAKPETPMQGEERLTHLRNALTRLKYVLEKALHSQHLDPNDDVCAFFDKLRGKVPDLEYNKKRVGTELTGPSHKDYVAAEVDKLLSRARALLGPAAEAAAASTDESTTYKGLNFNYLREAIAELEEAALLLGSKKLPSRIDVAVLKDQVSFHVDDFNQLLDTRLNAFIAEMIREGAAYSAINKDLARDSPNGIISAQLLDVVVGVHPARVAHATLQHLDKKIFTVANRVNEADRVLQNSKTSDPEEQIRRDRQRREYAVMKGRVEDTRQVLERLRASWAADEEDFWTRAQTAGANFAELAQGKKIKELAIAEEAAKAHDDLVYRCLPFMSPQYCRRYQLTYSNPCQIRIGLRFFDKDTQQFTSVANTCPQYFRLCAANPSADPLGPIEYLVPSRHQMWAPFDEFPEMVMGRRCVLSGVDPKADHERAVEEHKEIGAYFLMNGGERILRALVMQRCNAAINIHRDKFVSQGPHFSPKAVVIRCKRTSGITTQNYFYYTTIGEILFSFARKVVWHIPVSLLMFCCKPGLTPTSLFQMLTIGLDCGPSHAARVEAFLQHHRNKAYGELSHHLDYLTVVGRMYREYQQKGNMFHFIPDLHSQMTCHHDAWYGLFLLRRHVLPHLNADAPTPDLPASAHGAALAAWPGPQIVEELERKFHTLCSITRQLYGFTDGKTEHQGNDVPAYQEIFTSSQILVGAFEVCLNKYMKMFAYRMGGHVSADVFRDTLAMKSTRADPTRAEATSSQLRKYFDYCISRQGDGALAPMNRLLITGNFTLDREEDFYCPQNSGWVVMAEHLNFFRFFEQLKCIHRGKTIAEMRSSEVRRYPCEAYGFICMVHSPDGADCGVLNHLSTATVISNSMTPADWARLQQLIKQCIPNLLENNASAVGDRLIGTVPLWIEGCVAGYVKADEADAAAHQLRKLKAIRDPALVSTTGLVPRKNVSPLNNVEVVYVKPGSKDPCGLYIFTENGRLMRPVAQIESGLSEKELPFPLTYVGTWEQSWLDIASVPSDLADAKRQLNKKYQFMEQNGSNIISVTSNTIPFFEYNCSPRNLFQCGLSKQSAGTQLEALAWRKEAKLFRMYTPQKYICRTLPMDYFGLDDVSLGVNAVVAILAYTGYDMDDAIIINNTAVQRGMLNAGVTIAKVIHADPKYDNPSARDNECVTVFHNELSPGVRFTLEVDEHGLPPRRRATSELGFERDSSVPALQDETPVYTTARRYKRIDPATGKTFYEYTRHHVTRWKHFDKGEAAWVHNVVPLTYDGPDVASALVVFRIPRPPAVGDKFSSRHGQKGTMPLHLRSVNLPFSAETGITPDVIINPHAFPSRMTVGMVLELISAKLGAIEGHMCDFSAWNVVDERPRAALDIGDALAGNGFNRYGRERFVDGISGLEMEADVFVGISGYQRLRHMVYDKWQSRARTDAHTFRAVTKTGQPVKGRKRHGGVRIGEMERDGLLSHGISEVVLDRLLHVSDKTKAFICSECGGLLNVYERHTTKFSSWKSCKFCSAGVDEASDTIKLIDIPQVFRLWVAELAGVGVRVALNVK